MRRRLPYLTVADSAAPALGIGYGVGRLACFFVGDDYGRPTASAVGIAFPKGSPPMQSFESSREHLGVTS